MPEEHEDKPEEEEDYPEEEELDYAEPAPDEDESGDVDEDGTDGTMTSPPGAAATRDDCVRIARMLYKLLDALEDVAAEPTQAVPPAGSVTR
jgi:hypothetical protein